MHTTHPIMDCQALPQYIPELNGLLNNSGYYLGLDEEDIHDGFTR